MTLGKRIKIITGHYGSGKTEFALNYALKLAKSNKKTAIADLDVVNPYFRSREYIELFKENNIELLGSLIKDNAMDLPALSPDIMKPFLDSSYHYVIDLGGNHSGALAFSTFNKSISSEECDVYFILNANRPETSELDSTLSLLKKIEKTLNMKITGIVNNTHLIWETTAHDLVKGDLLAQELSKKTNIPIVYVSCKQNILNTLPNSVNGTHFSINMLNRKIWM